jgi:predicted TPR repeat methyltransferase
MEIALAHHRAGRFDLAIPIYRDIVAANPRNSEADKMLAIALFQSGAVGEAEHCARRAFAQKPRSVDAANILGSILGQLGRYDEAVQTLRPIETRLANFPGACLTYGLALRGLRDFASAAVWFAKAIERDPTLPDVYLNLGFVLAELGRRDEAIAALRSALERAPQSASARHMLASLDGSNPDAPPIDYVRSLFDEYAPRFERELTVDLGYRVPEILRSHIDAVSDARPRTFARALDLGCGTGLSGAAVKDRVAEIVGVDVAKTMIAVARAKKIYTALFAMEIGAYLASNDAQRKPFDLVIAADVFIYVGKLEGTFAAVAGRMAPKGLFAFSVEGHDGDSFVLRESGRYAHGVAYIERLAAAHGFAVVAREAIAIRKAKDGRVDGFAFVLERAG